MSSRFSGLPAPPTPGNTGRSFALPIERPGARYLTRIQMDRMKKAAAEATERAKEDAKLRGQSGLGVLLGLIPMEFLSRHRVKILSLVLMCGASAVFVIIAYMKKMRDDLRVKRTQLERIRLLVFHRLAALRAKSKHWEALGKEMDAELRDHQLLKISRVEAAIAMLFDELLTLTAQLHQHRNRTSTGSGELPAIEGKRDDS
uniref:Transmembrane protein n=1 Tax=Lotharella oceanica TaxID=641309 RepID=A0A7S2TTP6_9EUKA